ncbi:YVC1 Calcium channel YVC1 [Candida maltosa Xu316]|uniref:Calcium channel, putative n=1 Tax=Candida maltosa (strain Xu316) TaxID=1245528 RepID=M3J591_CANMX|nr:Calcium channel, putative [Candida maltosa Xu316]
MSNIDLEENNPLLPPSQTDTASQYEGSIYGENSIYCPNSRQTFRISTNLKLLIDKIIPICYSDDEITRADSSILTDSVIDLVYKAAGGKGDGKEGTSSYKYRGALVFCLLKVCNWYWQQAEFELTDNELYSLRALTAQTIAKIIIERETRDKYLFLTMLCHRYTIYINGADATPTSALELAVDMHSTIVIGSSGYQRCIKWLWRGWIIQSSSDPHSYVLYKGISSQSIRTHFDPARIKTPLYQNILEIFLSIIYLTIFTIVINTHSSNIEKLDIFEIVLYLFTLGYILDEFIKFYHVGYYYLGFWNVFNDTMYTIVAIAIGFRLASINARDELSTIRYDEISYRILACASPLMWSRLLLFLDAYKFVGAMIVVLKVMMKESILFFVLLFVVIIGFLQGFIGLDSSDGKNEATQRILISLVKAVIGGSSFDDMGKLVPPYASVLYYVYSFMLSVILMNILIALYSTAYAAIVENATDEYFALVAQKTLRYVRAPDQNLYVPPFNLIEVLITPLGWVLPSRTWKDVNYYVMLVIYSPLLAYITTDELANARRIQYNRYKGLPDDANENDTEWDLTDGYNDAECEGDTHWERIREVNSEINEELRLQRAGEQQDNEFMVNIHKFNSEIDDVLKPKKGIDDVLSKIDKLTALLEVVIDENKELKKKLELKEN